MRAPFSSFFSDKWHELEPLKWLFAPEPLPLDAPESDVKRNTDVETEVNEQDERRLASKKIIKERLNAHKETSRTIRGLFYTLTGTCLFCIITLMGNPTISKHDSEILLPILSYKISFDAFLVVGPVIISTLVFYLHIFIVEHRRFKVPPYSSHPMLINFGGWASRLAVVALFYWLAPVTLAVFWIVAEDRPQEIFLQNLTIFVSLILIILQFRRCPENIRKKALPMLAITTICFFLVVSHPGKIYQWTTQIGDDNIQVPLDTIVNDMEIGTDVENRNLSGANLSRRDLSNKNLCEFDLSYASLRHADLSNANLTGAILVGADLFGARMHNANITGVDLNGVKMESFQMAQVCEQKSNESDRAFLKDCEKNVTMPTCK